ncbi:hypothetical protein GHC20_08405 [Brucella sp. 2280]|nr:hypothetical protein GHC20_08405 [Brucella sp. 2280]
MWQSYIHEISLSSVPERRSDWIRSALWSFVLTRILSENRFTLFGMRSQQETAIALQRQDDSWSI